MSYRRTRSAAAALVALIALSIVLIGSATASASVDLITCTGTSQLSYNPGLTLQPQTVTMNQTDEYDCDPLLGPSFTGTAGVADTLSLSCLTPLAVAEPIEYTITWSDNVSSTLELTYTMTNAEDLLVSTIVGSVTEGRFSGSVVTGSWTFLEPTPQQCSTGITQQTGDITMTILG